VRYPEAKIKDAILHPELEIRTRALHYFSDSYSQDPSIMAKVIEAVETHGKEEAYRLIGPARDLRQTGESIDWVINELNDERSGDYESYVLNLSMVLLSADPALLVPRENAVLHARHFHPSRHAAFTERLGMLSWDAATCWRELEALCKTGAGGEGTESFDLARAERIVEALARHGGECEKKVHELLARGDEDDDQGEMEWLEPLVVKLAGRARLESTIPAIVDDLEADLGDFDNEQCAEALARIGTPAVLHAVAEAFPGAEHHFRLYAGKPLETIHSDLAVETCLRLLEGEEDEDIRVRLADAALAHYAEEAVEPARRLLLDREIDFGNRDLMDSLLGYCSLTGARFPEYDEWLARDRREREDHRQKIKSLEGDPMGLLRYAFETLAGRQSVAAAEPSPAPVRPMPSAPRLLPPSAPRAAPTTISTPRQKIGRNERCPCGSGKKFKHCCGRNA
jgi:hypothetical protein